MSSPDNNKRKIDQVGFPDFPFRDGTYHCLEPACTVTDKGRSAIERHYYKTHLQIKPYKCEIEGCDKTYHDRYTLHDHVTKSAKHNPKPVVLPDPNAVPTKKSHTVNDKPVFVQFNHTVDCPWPECEVVSRDRDTAERHYNKDHMKHAPYICGKDGCSEAFYDSNTLFHHQTRTARHGSEKLHVCQEPGCGASYMQPSGLHRHMASHTNAIDQFPCLQCGKAFQNDRNLKRHVHAVHAVRPRNFACVEPLCGKTFYSERDLQLHVDHVHLNLRPFGCEKCGSFFKTERDLQLHSYIHAKENPFPCRIDPNCNHRSNSKDNRDAHERTHTGETPFVCDWPGCTSRFTSRWKMRFHKIDHQPRPFPCGKCDKSFKNSKSLLEHDRLHTGERPYICDYPQCGQSFVTWYRKNDHFIRYHTTARPFICSHEGCGRDFKTKSEQESHEKHIHEKADNGEPVNLKRAELRIEQVLKDAGIAFEREQSIFFSCVDENDHRSARLDFVIPTEKAVVVLEVDETQHKGNDVFCEVARMARVHSALSLGGFQGLDELPPVLWIRYNPNQHRLDKGVRSAKIIASSGLTDREAALLDVIRNFDLGDRMTVILYMYYDSRTLDGDDGSKTIVPLVVDSPDYIDYMRDLVLPAIA